MSSRRLRLGNRFFVVACLLFLSSTQSVAEDGFGRDPLNGCSVFKPNLRAGELVVWKGSCANGMAQGNGIAQWSTKEGLSVTFEGTFSGGKLQGVGRMSASGGDRYDGTYQDGKRHGRGIYSSANGERYEGEYKENQRHGQGVVTSPLGVRITSEWRNGVRNSSTVDAPLVQAVPPAITSTQRPPHPAQQATADPPAQQQAEQQERLRLVPQQQQADQARRQQAVQEQQRQAQLAEAAAQEQRRQAQLVGQESASTKHLQGAFILWGILAFPLVVAAIVALSKWIGAVTFSDQFIRWIDARRDKVQEKNGAFARFFLRPVLWCFQSLASITASIENVFLRAAVRIAAWLYLAGFVVFLVYMITVIVIAIIMLVIGLWIVGAILGHADGPRLRQRATSRPEDREDALAHLGVRGKKVYSGSNWFNEELKGRVDNEGNLYKGTNWFTEEKIGRIDGDGNIYSGTNVMNETKVGRIDENGMLYKGSNWFAEERTGRIDNDGTIHQGTNWLNEQKKGRTGE